VVEFVDDLPKTLTGKIRRIELRQAELERAHGGSG
jgi:acetyl-CoA synthetase